MFSDVVVSRDVMVVVNGWGVGGKGRHTALRRLEPEITTRPRKRRVGADVEVRRWCCGGCSGSKHRQTRE
jgi:hypothetical protein